MIKLGTSYIEAADIQIATFVNATTVTLALRGGGQFTANDVPAEEVAAFRDLWDLVAASYPSLVEQNVREKNGIGLKELIERRAERDARNAARAAAGQQTPAEG